MSWTGAEERSDVSADSGETGEFTGSPAGGDGLMSRGLRLGGRGKFRASRPMVCHVQKFGLWRGPAAGRRVLPDKGFRLVDRESTWSKVPLYALVERSAMSGRFRTAGTAFLPASCLGEPLSQREHLGARSVPEMVRSISTTGTP